MEEVEQKIMGYKKSLFECGLLQRIEKERLDIERLTTAPKFDLYPCSSYGSNIDSDHFLKELTYLHTKYSVDCASGYSSFCIEVRSNGIFLSKTGKEPKKIIFERITDQEIHGWFLFLSKEADYRR